MATREDAASRSIRIVFRVLPAALLALASCTEQAPPAAEPDRLPNIVFILADDMGSGDIGAFNADSKIPTPHLDSLASAGMRFTDAHSPSAVCTPTRYGLLTGRYSWRTHMKRGVLKGWSPLLIDLQRSTIGSMLQAQGYTTAAIGKWHLGLGSAEVTDYDKPLSPGPNDVGFDYFFGIPASLDMPPYVYVENTGLFTSFEGDEVADSARRRDGGGGYWRAGPIARDFTFEGVLPKFTEQSVAYIEERAGTDDGRPFFLYVPLAAPHTPHMPLPEFLGTSGAGYYGDFTAQVDDTVGRIMAALEETGVADNTIVVFTSDNGSRWVPEDTEKWGHASNHYYRGQKGDIHEGGHRVPTIVSWPGHVEPGTATGFTISLTDFYATFAEVARAATGPDEGEDSESFLPTLLGDAQESRTAIISQSSRSMYAVRQGDWKLIEGLGSGGFTRPAIIEIIEDGPAGQLYNLADDPSETNNLYLERPDIVEQLTQVMDEIRGSDHLEE